MTLIVTLYVREGIVMASDSRVTNKVFPPGTTIVPGVTIIEAFPYIPTDAVYKTYLIKDRVGISVFGAADIAGVPISGYLDSSVRTHQRDTGTIQQIAAALVQEFRIVHNEK